MSAKLPSPNRRKILAASALMSAAAASSLIPMQAHAATANEDIRLFQINIPNEQLVDLHQRIAATRWPEQETVADDSQGLPLSAMQEIARYWGADYDWRKVETRLNALPQFMATIDGLDIHFIHVRSKHELSLIHI